MTTPEQWNNLIGATATDVNGDKIGTIGQVYLNDDTGQPEWATVKTGLFGTKESLVPLYNGQASQGELRLAVTKQQVKDAPSIDADDEHLDGSEVDSLYRYYADFLAPAGSERATSGTDYAGSGTDYAETSTVAGSGDDAMTRSEERLHVGTENVAAGRARLRKYVVTENVTQTVPVSHEEVRLEREPITEANRDAALGGTDITEAEHEVTLHAERPVVEKETVPVERVRLGTETVTEQAQVNEEIRKEQIDEPDVDADSPRNDL